MVAAMTDEEMLACATQFTLIRRPSSPDSLYELIVAARIMRNDVVMWAIVSGAAVLNHDNEWEREPLPSSRSDEFIARTRWPSAREAIAFAQHHMTAYPSGYKEDYNSG
jgi:hypothetical protein